MAQVIDYDVVKESVGELYKCGKEFPQKELFYSVPQEQRAAKATKIMADTIQTIADYFVPQKIGISLWNEAVAIAKVSSEKAITPRLLQDAITEAQRRIVAGNMARAEQEKQEEKNFMYGYVDTESKEIALTLLRWTYRQMGKGREISPYLPTEQQLTDFVMKNNIPRDKATKYRTIIRAYLNDYNFSRAAGKKMGSKLFNCGEKLELMLL